MAVEQLPKEAPADSHAAALDAQAYLKQRLAASSTKPSFRSIPIIDLKPSFTSGLEGKKEVANKINEACTTVGFFYITGHGLEDVCAETLQLAERFHSELSQSAKDAIHMKNSQYHRGYEPAAYTTVNSFESQETKEAFNWGYEAGLDPTGGDGKYVELDGAPPATNANQWPIESDIPGFYEGIAKYYGKVSLELQWLEVFALHFEILSWKSKNSS